ncbi:NAD-dependent epimerase/dehydratase family protein [Frigoriglobus tundricola]|uniref:UDP-glucose 4-epimerase n=1 Tax=Frigoriglobus tundricola TaxID=2774151 RepID=A0A6M5Z117_9BACT|nr:NAD(P)-dependent oxidoreductase [Frigoriglobus tundricola]QJW99143.1 UDP-glucose 4-epimerase [Frigoriglobus tundricola]
MRLLITGATGFIGLPAWRAARDTFDVYATARRPGAPGVMRVHPCDLLAPGAAEQLMDEVRPTHLLHLAWIATPGTYWTSPDNDRWVAASKRLLLAFARSGGGRAVVAGTCAEYDWTAAEVCRESDTPLRPQTTYGRCKLELSEWATAFGRARGVRVAWARLFWTYGPREHPGRLVPSVARSLLAGAPALCSAGTQERDFLHVDDVAAALVALTHSSLSGPINIGSGEPVAVRDVVAGVARACGRTGLVRLGARPTPPGEPPRVTADVTRLRDELGWRPRIDLATGLRATANWWRGEEQGVPKCG